MKTKPLFLAALLLFNACTVTKPVAATSNPIGQKTGTASAVYVFGLSFGGDASIRSACADGGITKVGVVDIKTTNFMYLYVKQTCIVTGE